MKKLFKIALPFIQYHIRYIESKDSEFEELDFFILCTLYENLEQKDSLFFELIMKKFGLNEKFNNFIIKRIQDLFELEFIKNNNPEINLEELMIGNVELHPLILKRFKNSNTRGIKKETIQENIYFYKSPISDKIKNEPRTKPVINTKYEDEKINDKFPNSASNKEILESYNEVIENKCIEKNRELFDSKLIEAKIVFLEKEISFVLNFDANKNNIILSYGDVASEILCKEISENIEKYNFIVKQLNKQILTNFDDESLKKLVEVPLDSRLDIDDLFVYNEKFNKINEKLEQIRNFFQNDEFIYFEGKWHSIYKQTFNLIIENEATKIENHRSTIILVPNTEDEKSEIYEKYYNIWAKNLSNNFLSKILDINDHNLTSFIIKRIYDDINTFSLKELHIVINELDENKKYDRAKFVDHLNPIKYFENGFDKLLYVPFLDITKNLIHNNKTNDNVKTIIFKNIALVEKLNINMFIDILNIYYFSFDSKDTVEQLKNTNLYKSYESIKSEISKALQLETNDLQKLDIKINSLNSKIERELYGFKVREMEQILEKREAIKMNDLKELKKSYKDEALEMFKVVEGALKDRKGKDMSEKIDSANLSNKEKNDLHKLRKIRNDISHNQNNPKNNVNMWDYEEAKKKYEELKKILENIKNIIASYEKQKRKEK
ncbi:Uncharacterised protein [Mycoplasmopsis californica]|uniref:RiboL-PSP-HEPN domain-containing protein n=1 Tax=Mycoplasmopsis equigenitalium TaxID=114883 RepID=A0ABY5J0R9_9BACT|nr:hypothetical protein [Mycoplasmopsis equigenitalium]UUD36857.1 hypothetical protein NPA09_03085 [Mycoplasmopsis equigenitalium]VEU69848.1 Uncharacterised protein [Mycoplasmopsis californica]